jgi:hypothetical protein
LRCGAAGVGARQQWFESFAVERENTEHFPETLHVANRTIESCAVHDQIRHATYVKDHLLSHICKPKQDVLANAAARYNAWALHVQMGLCEPSNRATVSALSLRGRNIDSEYLA